MMNFTKTHFVIAMVTPFDTGKLHSTKNEAFHYGFLQYMWPKPFFFSFLFLSFFFFKGEGVPKHPYFLLYVHIYNNYPRLFLPILTRVFTISVTLLVTYRTVSFSFCFFWGGGRGRGVKPIKAGLQYICHSIYIFSYSGRAKEFSVT